MFGYDYVNMNIFVTNVILEPFCNVEPCLLWSSEEIPGTGELGASGWSPPGSSEPGAGAGPERQKGAACEVCPSGGSMGELCV